MIFYFFLWFCLLFFTSTLMLSFLFNMIFYFIFIYFFVFEKWFLEEMEMEVLAFLGRLIMRHWGFFFVVSLFR